jgi:hypothetical protein
MDALFTSDRVRVGKKNEPDRKMPGDVGVRATATPDSPFVRILEVRDKNVPEHAVQSFISKVAAADVRRAVLVCVAATQEQLSIPDLQAHAHRRGVDLEIFTDWSTLIRTVVFASERTEIVTVESAVAAIRSRLIELELPADTVTAWDAATSADAVE